MNSDNPYAGSKMSSEGLAGLIVDALVDAGFIDKVNFDAAAEIAKVEIDVRKAAGDY